MRNSAAHFLNAPDEISILAVVSAWGSESPKSAVLAFVAENDRDSIPMLQEHCRKAGLQLIGAVFPELLNGENFFRQGAWLLHLNESCPYRIIDKLSSLPPGERNSVEKIAGMLSECESENRQASLLVIFDALVPTVETWMSAFYERLGRKVHYIGANAGSETFQPTPCLFDTDNIYQDAVLVACMPNLPGGTLAHGYKQPDNMLVATASHGNRIDTIDWRPAFDVYSELVQREYGAQITPENFYQYGVHFPFGIIRASSEVLVRIPVSLAENGALYCIGEVPKNTILTILRADSSESPVNDLASALSNTDCEFALVFYCAGRRMHDPNRATTELHSLVENTGLPLIGVLSLGEIGSSSRDGYPLFQNATIVCSPWSRQ